MSVNGAIVLAGGALVGVTAFLVGRYLASLTAEQAAEMKRHNPGLDSLATLHRFGNFVMVSAPIVFVAFAYVVFSGMVD